VNDRVLIMGDEVKAVATLLSRLKEGPTLLNTEYGTFYVGRVELHFDGEQIGALSPGDDENGWDYTHGPDAAGGGAQ